MLRECLPLTMSGIRCKVSGVVFFNLINLYLFFLQSVGASRCRVSYQRGLPSLLSLFTQFQLLSGVNS